MSDRFTVPTLRGIIVRDEHDQIVVQASPADVQRFAPQRGREVDVREAKLTLRTGARASRFYAPPHDPPADVGRISPLEYLYDKDGRPVARIVEANMYTDAVAVHRLGDVVEDRIPGVLHVEIKAEGLPGVRVV